MGSRTRLDQALMQKGLVATRSQAENYIRLGFASVNGEVITKTGYQVSTEDKIQLTNSENYVSRAGLKLSGANEELKVDFKSMVVLDVGSSTGGFTDYALQNGAKKVIAVDVGTDQLHPKLRQDKRVELHEKTDIRDFKLKSAPDIIVVDVSFISLRAVLPHLVRLSGQGTKIIALLKPQFEAGSEQINRGIIKNDHIRRAILKGFESWTKNLFNIVGKVDSNIAGSKGNLERFYLLKPLIKH